MKKSKAKTTGEKEKGQKKAKAKAGGTMSGLDAAAKVLAEAGEPLSCKAIVERALAYWLLLNTGLKHVVGPFQLEAKFDLVKIQSRSWL